MTNEQILLEHINTNGFIETLVEVFGSKISLEIDFSKRDLMRSIDEICFSVRSQNALRRSGLHTVHDVVNAIQKGALSRIRNLGEKSVYEIKTKIIIFAFEQLSQEGKLCFLREFMKKNSSSV